MARPPDTKMIENHIKDLLFKTSTSPDVKSNLTPFLYDSKCLLANIENEVYKKDVVDSKISSSQLIDLNVLTNFAAKHVADIRNNVILNAPAVLPHPEFENDFSSEDQKNTELSVQVNTMKKPKNSQKDKRNRKKGKSKKDKDKISEEPPPVYKKGSSKKVSKSHENQKDEYSSHLSEDTKVYSLLCFQNFLKFSCEVCNFEGRSKDTIDRHLHSEAHKQNIMKAEEERILPFLPGPLPSQAEAITRLLRQCHQEFGFQKEDLLTRDDITVRLKKFVELEIPGCCLELVGSSVTGFGLKSSMVDFSFKVGTAHSIPDSLQLLYEKLKADPSFSGVVSKFKEKTPGIELCDQHTGLGCHIEYDRGVAEKLSKLLSLYYQLDPRVPDLGTSFRYWAKLCGIDSQEKGTLPSYSYPLMLVYFLQQVQPPVLPVLHEVKEYGNADFAEQYLEGKIWKSENQDSLGELWIKLFHFYNYTYEVGKHVVCIRQLKRLLCSEKNWSTKFYAIEDPFVRRNVAHVIPSFQVFQYIHRCFFRTHRYFAYPQIREGKIELYKSKEFDSFILQQNRGLNKKEYDENSDSESQDFEDQDPELDILEFALSLKEMQVETVKQKSLCSWISGNLKFDVNSYIYRMDDATVFKGKRDLPYSCKLCKSSGHTRKKCPKDELPPRTELPPMTPEFLKMINKALYYIRDKNCVDDNDRSFVTKKMQEIESHIRKRLPDARLSMFGSFYNGFGFKTRSDMDFCLTFDGHDDGKDFDSSEVIEAIATELRKFPRLENILPVTSAKVPIVKFSCAQSGIEGDISLYNTLALANTQLLEAYSKIDSRVQILGFALKYFAKLLGICDASRGSLSSYAYILMVIYFLQQRKPPVIPVLQELYDEEPTTQQLMDGWNVSYFKDLDKLSERWPDLGKNQESAAELWIGLLSFYAYDFDWRELVVSIRQRSPLTRFQKLWVTDQLAIEDPFDLNHNLGTGLSHKMNMYILKTFVRGRERFGTPPDDLYPLVGYEVNYLFDRLFLNMGAEPPHDRGCRTCGKIGHIAKNCNQEKTCAFCKKNGHLVKSCPEKLQKAKQKRIQGAFNAVARRPKDDATHKQLMQMGYPSHRLPAPASCSKNSPPPPGFNFPQASTNFPLPITNFPRMKLPAGFPAFSPPKNFHNQDKMGPGAVWQH